MKSTKAKIQTATNIVQSLPEVVTGDEGMEMITANLDIELSAWIAIATIARKREWSVEDVIELTVTGTSNASPQWIRFAAFPKSRYRNACKQLLTRKRKTLNFCLSEHRSGIRLQ